MYYYTPCRNGLICTDLEGTYDVTKVSEKETSCHYRMYIETNLACWFRDSWPTLIVSAVCILCNLICSIKKTTVKITILWNFFSPCFTVYKFQTANPENCTNEISGIMSLINMFNVNNSKFWSRWNHCHWKKTSAKKHKYLI